MMNLKTGGNGGQERRDGIACWAGIQIRRADNVSLDQVQSEIIITIILNYHNNLYNHLHRDIVTASGVRPVSPQVLSL